MIKYIHCFGTSYTAGGGHEFDGRKDSLYLLNLETEYKKKYPNEIQTQFNFSYPGQLQKLVGNDIEVINHAKSGYGNELMYNEIWEIVSNPEFNPKEHIFILEFSGIGRKLIWSNTINDYIITNYTMDDDGYELIYNGTAVNYYYDSVETTNLLNKMEQEIIQPFYKESISLKSVMKDIDRNTDFLISYLKHFSCNFFFSSPPYSACSPYDLDSHYFDFEGNQCFVTYYGGMGYTIEDDTNGLCKDGHMGMTGAKKVSKYIYNHLINNKFISK